MWKGLPDPNFDINFLILQVSPCALWGRTLRILVFNIDVNRKHRIVGQTLLDLADVDLSQGKLVSPRFFDQVGHQTTNESIGNKDFFTK